MKSQIANAILQSAGMLTPAATPGLSKLTIPTLIEKKPGIWSTRLSGKGDQDAIDVRLTFAEQALTEVWVRGTLWSPADIAGAWNGVRIALTHRHGQPKKWRERPALDGREWAIQHETMTIEKRESREGDRLLTQIILVRTFDQPNAASTATKSLGDLLGPVAVPASILPVRPARSGLQSAEPVETNRRWRTTVTFPDPQTPYPRIRENGPYRPKWRSARPRPAPTMSFGDGPLFYVTSFVSERPRLGPVLQALDDGFDALAIRSDWEPFIEAGSDNLRCHSSRWWWLGGGIMLHLFVREYSGFGEITSTIVIHGYQEMDGPPEQSVRPTPTLQDVLRLVSKGTERARMVLAEPADFHATEHTI